MTTTSEPARLIRGYGWWTLLLMIVVGAGAWGLSLLEPARYRAEATVVVEPRLRANITPMPADPATESEIASSSAVLRPAATSLGVSQQTLADGLRVTPAAGTSVAIAYEASTAATARTRAQTVATQYLSYRNATTAQSGLSATLVTPAASASRVTWLPLWLYVVIGAAVGLILGVLLARYRSRDRVHGRNHFEQLTGLPVLATIPRAPRSHGPGAPLPVLLRSPASADAEAYRYLRARLEARLEGPATVLVTSAHGGEGRSTTAANLAIVLAQSGRRVVLIDTDVRGPVLHQMFELSRDRGLTGILTGDISGASALRPGPVPNLRLMAAGPDQDGAPDLLATSFGDMLRELKNQCDVIVLDSAPALRVADAVALASVSDAVLLVADYNRLTRTTARRAASELTAATAGAVAAVLIGVPERNGGLVPHTRAGRAPAPTTSAGPDRFAALEDPSDQPTALSPAAPSHAAASPTFTAAPVSGAGPAPAPAAAPSATSADAQPAPGLAALARASAPGTKSSPRQATATGPAFARTPTDRDPTSSAPAGSPATPSSPTAPASPPTRPDSLASSKAQPAPADRPASAPPASSSSRPASAPPFVQSPPSVSAKAAVPKPRVYSSAAAAEAAARVQAKVTAEQKRDNPTADH
ncbi:P-loop NTPase [Actinoplanes sp. NPDC049596]|uniref:nucleotide-binding protein n=1 Tax=unclassified Actinoplanes TaxID=2626549 RepID=UPI003435120E